VKKNVQKKDYSVIQLFIVSFFGMLMIFTVLIKYFSPSVDVSIGDYRQEPEIEEQIVNVDGRLSDIQDEDQGKSFADLMKKAEDVQIEQNVQVDEPMTESAEVPDIQPVPPAKTEPVYKVYIGTYTTAEQAKVAKDIISEANLNLNPIVKCVGSNNYTLQVGIFKNKSGAETLLTARHQNHLPGRIVQED
jgi:hypothetical protein